MQSPVCPADSGIDQEWQAVLVPQHFGVSTDGEHRARASFIRTSLRPPPPPPWCRLFRHPDQGFHNSCVDLSLISSLHAPAAFTALALPPAPAAMDLTLWQYQFRIIMLGDSTVGKSSLLKRYTEDLFLESINQTVGVDFYVHFLEVEPGVRVKLQFWDTAGQERFRSVTRSYYRNSVGGLLVFDMTNRASFDHVQEWHAEVCERVRPQKVLFVLVGQKSDRGAEGQRAVSREEAEKLAGQLGVPYVEASAKTGHNVKDAFELLARRIYQGLRSGEVEPQEGWDGVKCAALRPPPQLQRDGPARPSTPPRKCCP
ncbi:ras-related protein Rab-42b [Pungitius pungitius]|uniref:ras-related protein Rab-42b n=1 Tax=Pungitius pungitius TaxID=134920 RepID=UPI002E12FC3F